MRWNSVVAEKARKAKVLADFSMAGKVRSFSHHPQLVRSWHHVFPHHQVCLVTGGARGLGNEFCKAFVQSGCTSLAIVDLKEDEAAASAEELVKQACGADSPF